MSLNLTLERHKTKKVCFLDPRQAWLHRDYWAAMQADSGLIVPEYWIEKDNKDNWWFCFPHNWSQVRHVDGLIHTPRREPLTYCRWDEMPDKIREGEYIPWEPPYPAGAWPNA